MEDKANEATPLRPEGDRVLNAPLVEMNLTNLIAQVKQEKTWGDSDRNSITIFKSDTIRLLLMGLHQGAELKPHTAKGEITVQVIEGKINFNTKQHSALLEKGQMVALQANIEHSVVALTETFFLLTLALNK